MKVFVPFFEAACVESALEGARLVPFEHGYPMLHIDRVQSVDRLPAPGCAQIIRPEDWPRPERHALRL